MTATGRGRGIMAVCGCKGNKKGENNGPMPSSIYIIGANLTGTDLTGADLIEADASKRRSN
ncbi:MAG: pentapeptide repeat-containing protein [Prevotella sp.]|nr:pentapeptide repeat-containing protein [Prevotella sp.]